MSKLNIITNVNTIIIRVWNKSTRSSGPDQPGSAAIIFVTFYSLRIIRGINYHLLFSGKQVNT